MFVPCSPTDGIGRRSTHFIRQHGELRTPTQNIDASQNKYFDCRQVHVFQATKWLTHGFFGDTEYPLGG